MEKIGLAICYVGVGAFYGALAYCAVKWTKVALTEVKVELTEAKAEPEPVAAS